jgi:hypothetical protein
MVPLIHIKSSGKNFLNSDLSITLKQISFADGQKFN